MSVLSSFENISNTKNERKMMTDVPFDLIFKYQNTMYAW
jgi:hypothetical protein